MWRRGEEEYINKVINEVINHERVEEKWKKESKKERINEGIDGRRKRGGERRQNKERRLKLN